jgi:hypothetical protein
MTNRNGIEYVLQSQVMQMTPATLRAFDKVFDKGNVVIVRDVTESETVDEVEARQNADDEEYRVRRIRGN